MVAVEESSKSIRHNKFLKKRAKKMNNIINTIESLHNPLVLGTVNFEKIKKAEEKLDLKFADEFCVYLQNYGCLSARGIDLTGITKNKEQNVITVTQREKEYNPYIPKNQYVIENLGIGGIIALQDSSGAVYMTTHKRAPKKMYNTLSEYIESRKKDYDMDGYTEK
jgi:hypothetical protein